MPDSARVQLQALGEFDATNLTFEVDPPIGSRLAFPVDTLAVVAHVDGRRDRFLGYGERHDEQIDVLLWPQGRPCALHASESLFYPAAGGGQALGFSAVSDTLLLVGGDAGESPAVVGAVSVSTATGETSSLEPGSQAAMKEPRAFATVTPFGSQLLVAGGEDPLIAALDPSERRLSDTAEVFDPGTHAFVAIVDLRAARARHAALELADGSTLLVGGRGTSNTALRTLERISPGDRIATVSGFLNDGRISPVALRLDTDEIFVASGLDAQGTPVATLEYLSPDGTEQLQLLQEDSGLEPRFDRAYARMPGGSVLSVGGCSERPPTQADEAASCEPEGGWDFSWILRDGSVCTYPLGFPAPDPLLIPATDGAPLLVVRRGTSDQALYRFNPWRNRFEPLTAVLPPMLSPKAPDPVALSAGAFAFLSSQLDLVGMRYDARSAFEADVSLVTLPNPEDSLWPAHLAPDRPPTACPGDWEQAPLRYDGKLFLSGGRVFVTDATYRDVRVEVEVETGGPPQVLLGRHALGAADCRWPELDVSGFELVRRNADVVLRAGSSEVECRVKNGRLSLGFAAPNTETVQIREIKITRLD